MPGARAADFLEEAEVFELAGVFEFAEVFELAVDVPEFAEVPPFSFAIILLAEAAVCWLSFVSGPFFTISSFTFVVPVPIIPSFMAAAFERSISRLATKGPRSFTRTSQVFPFARFVTFKIVLKGSDL